MGAQVSQKPLSKWEASRTAAEEPVLYFCAEEQTEGIEAASARKAFQELGPAWYLY